MNWYKQSKIEKEAFSIKQFIFSLLAAGLTSSIIAPIVSDKFNISESDAQVLVDSVADHQSQQPPTETPDDIAPQTLKTPNEGITVNNDRGGVGSSGLEDMIKRHEGFKARAYDDTVGVRTIGYGFNLDNANAREKIESLNLDFEKVYNRMQLITEAQADLLFRGSFNEARNTARLFAKNFFDLPPIIQDVLIDMSYNLGSRINNFVKMRDAIEAQNWDDMAKEMTDSKWYSQVGNRSKELIQMVKTI